MAVDGIVGEARIIVTADLAPFEAELAAATTGASSKMTASASAAGVETGAALRSGVASESGQLAFDLEGVGLGAGVALSKGVDEGGKDILKNTESKVEASTGRIKGALNDLGSKAKSSLTNLGVPASFLSGTAVATLAIGAVAAGALDLGNKMQKLDAAIATTEGVSVQAATAIGNAFLNTAGQTKFSGLEMAAAFGQVAGQLKSAEGGALTTAQGLTFMSDAAELASAKNIDLNTATSALASTMQAFQIPLKGTVQASDNLFAASNATGQGVDTVGAALAKLKSRLGGLAPDLQQMTGLLVDLTDHGETGRSSITALSTVFNTLIKPAADAQKATRAFDLSVQNLPASLKPLAAAYQDGTLHGAALTKITDGLTTQQHLLFSAFMKASDAARSSNATAQTLGITVTNAKGQMLPLATILGELQAKIAGQTKAQAAATLTAMGFGSSSARLVALVRAGPAAFEAATNAVSKQNQVHHAAQIQAKTLGDQFATLKSTVIDFGAQLGQVLLPLLSALMGLIEQLVPIIGTALKAAFDILGPPIEIIVKGIELLIAGFKDFEDPLLVVAGILSLQLIPRIIQWGVDTTEAAAFVVRGFGEAASAALTGSAATTTAITEEQLAFEGFETTVLTGDATMEAANLTLAGSFTAMLGPIAAVAAAGVGAFLITTKLLDKLREMATVKPSTQAGSGLTHEDQIVLDYDKAHGIAQGNLPDSSMFQSGYVDTGIYKVANEWYAKTHKTPKDQAAALMEEFKKLSSANPLAGVKPLSVGSTSASGGTSLTSAIITALREPAGQALQSLKDLGIPAQKAAAVLHDAVEPFQDAIRALEKAGFDAKDAVEIADAGQKVVEAQTKAAAAAAKKAGEAADKSADLSGVMVNGIQVAGSVYDAAIGSAFRAQTGQSLTGPSGGGAVNIHAGAIVINPAPGNDSASLLATRGMLDEMLKTLGSEIGGGVSPLGSVTAL